MRFLVQGYPLLLLVSIYSCAAYGSSALARLDEPATCLSGVMPEQGRECLPIPALTSAERAAAPRTEAIAWSGLGTDMPTQGNARQSQAGAVMDGRGARSATRRPPSRLSSRLNKPSGTLLESRLYRRPKKKVERQQLDRLDAIYPPR